MKITRLCEPAKILMWTAILIGLILSGSYTTLADPGLTPSGGSKTCYVDFSNFPSGSASRQGLAAWQAQGWSSGARCLQLVRASGYLEVVVDLPENVSTACLAITHRSAYAPGCANSGFAPMSLTINGSTLTQYYSPPAGVPGSASFTTDRWEVTDWLTPGRNRVRITAGTLCSVYEVQRFEISITATTSHLIEDYQMAHGITSNRPVDNVSAFSPDDHRAVTGRSAGQRSLRKPSANESSGGSMAPQVSCTTTANGVPIATTGDTLALRIGKLQTCLANDGWISTSQEGSR
jgi:hypothetical protein